MATPSFVVAFMAVGSAGLVLETEGVAVEFLVPPDGVREEATVLGAVLEGCLSSGEPLDGLLDDAPTPVGGGGGGGGYDG